MGYHGYSLPPAMEGAHTVRARTDIHPRLIRMLIICAANALIWLSVLAATTGLI